jgi:hypothetical protein
MSGLLKTPRQFAIATLGVLLVASVATAQSTKAKPRPPRPKEREGKVTAVRVPVPVYGGPTVYKSGMKIPCPAFFSFDFIITTDGPAEVKYTWVFSDGHAQPPIPPSKFARSGRTHFVGGWNVGKPGETLKAWMKLKVLSPNEFVSNRSSLFVRCQK